MLLVFIILYMSGEFLFTVRPNLRVYLCEAPYNAGSASGPMSIIICGTSPRGLEEAKPSVNVVSLEAVDRSWSVLVRIPNSTARKEIQGC
jgi:hypothetical protein